MSFAQAVSIGSEISCTTRLGKIVEGKVIALDEDHHVIVVRILDILILINAHLLQFEIFVLNTLNRISDFIW